MPQGTKFTEFTITYQSLLRVLVVGGIVALLWQVRELLAALAFAVVVASAIEPGVSWLRHYRVPRIAAVLLIYVVTLTILSGVILLTVPALAAEFTAFLDSFPRYQRILLQEARSFQDLPFIELFSENAQDFILNPPFDLRTLGSGVLGIIFTIFGGVASGLILLVVSFYLASQEDGIERFLRTVTPLNAEEHVIDLWRRSQRKIGLWLRGQLLLAAVVGIFVYLALTILGIRYALILACIAAIFEIIPIIGPILAAVPAVFFGFLTSPLLGLIVAIVYIIIQQLESHLLVPVVMRHALGLNPLVVILSLLAGAEIGGILGMFLAVPVAAILVEFLTDTDRMKRGLPQFPSRSDG